MASNQELSEQFSVRCKEIKEVLGKAIPLDYYDRFLDLAIYLNETLEDSDSKNDLVEKVEDLMTDAYTYRDG